MKAVSIAAALVICTGACTRHAATVASRVEPGTPQADLLVRGAVLVQRGQDTTRTSVVIGRGADGFTVRELVRHTNIQVTDTLDLTGVFLHRAHALDQSGPAPGTAPLYVVRRGISPGTAAVGLIGATESPLWRKLEPSENYPAGEVDTHVGCYTVERGVWNDQPSAAAVLRHAFVPVHVRLHWQYLWHVGRETALVATDANGQVPGAHTNFFAWWPHGDSVRVSFGTGFESAAFHLARAGQDLVGEVHVYGHTVPGARAHAAVRLRRRECAA